GLAQANDGNLYGATIIGGAYGYGTIFKVTPLGSLTSLVSLNGNNGAYPSCVLVQGVDGNLYGTTESGGTNCGFGTVFKMALSGVHTLLYSFSGGTDGGVPVAGLVEGPDGTFYGTTLQGGSSGGGTVFQISATGVLKTLYSFNGGSDGANPWGG